jgi:hypothetical protein
MTDLRCHRCSHSLNLKVGYVVRLWGIFRLPAKGLVIEPAGAVSRRCRHCGWINIFDRVEERREAVTPSWRDVELKERTG